MKKALLIICTLAAMVVLIPAFAAVDADQAAPADVDAELQLPADTVLSSNAESPNSSEPAMSTELQAGANGETLKLGGFPIECRNHHKYCSISCAVQGFLFYDATCEPDWTCYCHN